jgi:hypothetical protein
MIRDREAYARLRVAEQDRALRFMDLDASIAVAELLLTSSLNEPTGRPRSRPRNLARSLGIAADRVHRTADATLA